MYTNSIKASLPPLDILERLIAVSDSSEEEGEEEEEEEEKEKVYNSSRADNSSNKDGI
jgi:hypothetical protein